MMPDGVLSSANFPDVFAYEGEATTNFLEDFEFGGVALNDPSQGLLVKLWRCFIKNLRELWVEAPGVPETLVHQATYGISEVSLTFDQNMRPFIAFVELGQAKFLWFDSVPEQQIVTVLPAGSISPKGTLDDKRPQSTGTSDIVLAYVLNNNLYMRIQRERYKNEYLLLTGVPGRLMQIGMNNSYRLQFNFGRYRSIEEVLDGIAMTGSPVTSLGVDTPDDITQVSEATIWNPVDEEGV